MYLKDCSESFTAVLYALKKSFTKKIIVVLEYEFVGKVRDQYYKPVVRLLSNDFEGVAFLYDDWKEFETNFDEIDKYFLKRESPAGT